MSKIKTIFFVIIAFILGHLQGAEPKGIVKDIYSMCFLILVLTILIIFSKNERKSNN